MFRRVLVMLCFVLGASSVSAAGLKVGMSPDYPPLAYKQDGTIVGIEADNVKAVGAILGLKMTIVELPFAELMPALADGRIDVIMSGFSVTDERAQQVRFTQPYMQVGQMAIIHRDKIGSFAQPWAIFREGVRIGVEPGTTGAAYAEGELPDAQIKYFAGPDEAFEGLRKDEIDLYVHDAPTSWQLATNSANTDLISLYNPLTEEALAWAVRKDDPIVLEQLNEALATMQQNGSLRYILNRWIPVTVEVR